MDRTPRFYIKPNSFLGQKFVINDEQVGHIKKSLRLNVGDEIILFDGNGNKWLTELSLLTNHKAESILKEKLQVIEPKVKITLIQSIPMPKKIDLIIKKLTEIGITDIYPIETDYSQIRARDIQKKYSRWEKLIIESCKQCERDYLLELHDPITFDDLEQVSDGYSLKLIASAKNGAKEIKNLLNTIERTPREIVYLIGPEGGFSESELQTAKEIGFEQIVFNTNILRTETAAIYLGSILKFFFS